MEPSVLHRHLLRQLRARQGEDGGFPTSVAGPSEVEPTVLAAIALRDRPATAWLERRQRPDGGFREADGRIDGPTTAALAALVLDRGAARRSFDYAVARRGRPLPDAGVERRGWGWTAETRSFVEPTSRMLIASTRLAPRDPTVRSEAVALLEEWQTTDGGWNHGVASVLGVDLPAYAQTTAIALIALWDERKPFVRTALELLQRRWRDEQGGLTVAQGLLAFRLHGATGDAAAARAALAANANRPGFLRTTVSLAWAVLGTGPDAALAPLRGRA